MSLKIILTIFFLLTFLYSLIRPFNSSYAKLFILLGSFLGMLFSYNTAFVAKVSGLLGLEKTSDLIFYIVAVMTFIFCIYTIDRLKKIEISMTVLAKEIAKLSIDQKSE